MIISREKYLDKYLYFYDKKSNILLKKILDKKYQVCAEYKNDNRTYVAKIKVDNDFYLLKKFYPRKKLKQLFTFFKDSESLATLKNVEHIRNKGVEELVSCIGVIEARKKNIIVEEALIMEFCEGRKPKTNEEFQKIVKSLNKIYKKKRFHGDCNPNNFIIKKTGDIKIIDTKLKKMWFGDYRKHFDILVLMKHIPKQINYPYKKNIYYYFAKFIRKIRDVKNALEEKKING